MLAATSLIADACGRPTILEVNPLAGLHPEHSDLPIICSRRGISYEQLISTIIDSALERREVSRARQRLAARM
jgi:D-alanine-D-alanine ligase